jgi:(1->4)-alpha-D-glucan 1-alpha-D-glucosylmutase
VRARLAVLSEIPDEWGSAVDRWFQYNAKIRDPQLDPGDEYQLYQTLVGSWPLDLTCDGRASLSEFTERLLAWRLKSLHEEKIHTSWGDPDSRYDRASGAFVRQLLDADCSGDFLRDLTNFVHCIAPAAALNGLTQTVLHCTCPGIPDVYQGTEFWDLSMVDPDNRRPVDFSARAAAIEQTAELPRLLSDWPNGFAKQGLIRLLLGLREEYADCFLVGDYTPVFTNGSRKDSVIAFIRSVAKTSVLIAVPRLCARACIESGTPLPSEEFWHDTEVSLPQGLSEQRWRNAIDGAFVEGHLTVSCRELFARFPAALLVTDRDVVPIRRPDGSG